MQQGSEKSIMKWEERRIIKLKEVEILPSRWRWTGKRGAGRMKPLPRPAYTESFTAFWVCYCTSHPCGLAQLFSVTWSPSPLLSSQQLHLSYKACPIVTSSKKPSLIPWSRDCSSPLWAPTAPVLTLTFSDSTAIVFGVFVSHTRLWAPQGQRFCFLFWILPPPCIYSRLNKPAQSSINICWGKRKWSNKCFKIESTARAT